MEARLESLESGLKEVRENEQRHIRLLIYALIALALGMGAPQAVGRVIEALPK